MTMVENRAQYLTNTFQQICCLFHAACHKVNPSGGLGAISAMHDAIALANLLYALPSTTTHDITVAFSEYQTERLPPAIDAYNSSLMLSKLLKGGLTGALALFMANHVPDWLWKHVIVKKMIVNRPQVGFLKAVEDRGTLAAKVSWSSEKATRLFNERMRVVTV